MRASKQIQEQRRAYRVEHQKYHRRLLLFQTGKTKTGELRQATKESLRAERLRLQQWFSRLKAAAKIESLLHKYSDDDKAAILALTTIAANISKEANNV